MIAPPRWSDSQLAEDIQLATAIFRRERMQEPLEAYLGAFEHYQGSVEDLPKASLDLNELNERAPDVLTRPRLLEAFPVSGRPSTIAGRSGNAQ